MKKLLVFGSLTLLFAIIAAVISCGRGYYYAEGYYPYRPSLICYNVRVGWVWDPVFWAYRPVYQTVCYYAYAVGVRASEIGVVEAKYETEQDYLVKVEGSGPYPDQVIEVILSDGSVEIGKVVSVSEPTSDTD